MPNSSSGVVAFFTTVTGTPSSLARATTFAFSCVPPKNGLCKSSVRYGVAYSVGKKVISSAESRSASRRVYCEALGARCDIAELHGTKIPDSLSAGALTLTSGWYGGDEAG